MFHNCGDITIAVPYVHFLTTTVCGGWLLFVWQYVYVTKFYELNLKIRFTWTMGVILGMMGSYAKILNVNFAWGGIISISVYTLLFPARHYVGVLKRYYSGNMHYRQPTFLSWIEEYAYDLDEPNGYSSRPQDWFQSGINLPGIGHSDSDRGESVSKNGDELYEVSDDASGQVYQG